MWLEIKNTRDLEKTKQPQHNYLAKSKRLLQGETTFFKDGPNLAGLEGVGISRNPEWGKSESRETSR